METRYRTDRTRGAGSNGVGRGFCVAALLALLAFHGAANVWWLKQDNLPQAGDPGVHLGFAKTFYRTFTDPGQPNVVKRFAAGRKVSTGLYPPMLHAAGALTALLWDNGKAGYVVVNTVAFLALIAASYLFARMLFGRGTALYAACIVSLAPFLYGISRVFLTDLLSALFVVCAYGALAKTARFQNRAWVVALALISGLGFWARWTTALYYVLPACVVFGFGLKEAWNKKQRSFDRSCLMRLLIHAALFTLVAGVIIAPWFVWRSPNIPETYARSFAPVQGQFRPFAAFTWFTYPVYIVNQGTFLLMAVLGLVGLAVALPRARRNDALLLVVLWCVGSWVMLMLLWPIRHPAPRYIVPMLPAIALLSVVAVDAIRRPRWRHAAMALFMAALLFQYGNVTFASYGPLAKVELPVPVQHRAMARGGDAGLVVYTDKVDASGAKYGPPFRGENWIDRALGAIVATECERHYIRWPQANILLVGAPKEAVETVQKDYWPLATPLIRPSADGRLARGRRERTVAGALVPLSQRRPRPAIIGRLHTHGQEERSVSLVLGQTGHVDVPVPCTLTVEFETETPIDAVSLTFAGSDVGAPGCAIQYRDHDTSQWADVSPPVDSAPSSLRYHFYAFEPISTGAVRIELRAAPSGPGTAVIERLDFYRRMPQPRPLILSGVSPSLEAVDWRELDTKDYVILAEKTPAPYRVPELAEAFDVIDRFQASLFGHWTPRWFTVLARKERPVITFETTPALRVEVSDDQYPNGRWDLPWWRSNHTTAVHAPPDADYWACRTPAVAEVELGEDYAVDGIEIVPYSEEKGVQEATVERWDSERAAWVTLSPTLWRIDRPKHKTGDDKWLPKTIPDPWAEPIRTSRLRFSLLRGGPAADSAQFAYLSNIFIYGRKDEAPSSPAQPAAKAAIP